MPTRLRYNSVEAPLTLPPPYRGVVKPGGVAYLRDDPATVLARFGGVNQIPAEVTLEDTGSYVPTTADYAGSDPRVVAVSAAYTVLDADTDVAVNSTGGAVAIAVPATYPEGQELLIWDEGGAGGTNAITVTVGGSATVNGSGSTVVINSNYGRAVLTRRGTNWSVAASTATGGTFNPAAPGAIGGTTPAAGSFTTLSASGLATVQSLKLTAGNAASTGGNADPTLGTNFAGAGAVNPTTAAQHGWQKFTLSDGSTGFLPYWK